MRRDFGCVVALVAAALILAVVVAVLVLRGEPSLEDAEPLPTAEAQLQG